ncbi:MAG: glycoside hydrolase family 13 protein [Psychrobium sp.]
MSCALITFQIYAGGCELDSNSKLRDPLALDESGEFVPTWAKKAIWYQVFPERFRDGDKSNNPTIDDIKGADPQELPVQWSIHPWGSDWYEMQAYEKANGEPERWKHMLRRRYGGDLQGVIDKLDYIDDLGINAIYLNPVFDSPSLHKYDAASYHHIDPNFGPDPEGDRKLMENEIPLDPSTWVWTKADKLALRLIKEAHKRDIKIIFDGVFNHMGINSFAFKDLVKNQQDSPYKEWFTVTQWQDEKTKTAFDYLGWFGNKSLPEFSENENGIVKGPKEYIFAATQRWMNPKNEGIENGIDGWRLDVAFCVAHNFWKDWRKHVKAINSQAYLTAEIVESPENVKPFLLGDEFDGEMNYNFAFTSAEFFFNPKSSSISVSEFDKKLKELRGLYPKGVAYVNQNLFGSHDSNRIGSHIVNRGIGNYRDWGNYFNLSQSRNKAYDVRKPNQEEIQLQKLFAIFQFSYVGAPMVYYGDEVGMWGANDPDDRKPMIWSDIKYADEIFNPDGSTRTPDKVSVNKDLHAHYKKLAHIRSENSALSLGDFKSVIKDNAKQLYGFTRTYKNDSVTVILNNSSQERIVELPTDNKTQLTDLLSDKTYIANNGKVKITIPAKFGVILK